MQDLEEVGDIHKHCPFCRLSDGRTILLQNELAFVIEDGFPVSAGHMLVIPRRHSSHYFELQPLEKAAIWELVDKAVAFAMERFRPDGFNIGFNVMAAAGQTVFHTHVHIIPRYEGDVLRPEGGVRNVIPDKGLY